MVSLLSGIEGLGVEDAVELLADKVFVRDLDESKDPDAAVEIIRETAYAKNIELKSELGSVIAAFASVSEEIEHIRRRLDRSESERVRSQERLLELASNTTDLESLGDEKVIQVEAQNQGLEDKVQSLQSSLGSRNKFMRFLCASLFICLGILAWVFLVPLVPLQHRTFSIFMLVASVVSALLPALFPKIGAKGLAIVPVPLLLEYLKMYM